MFREIAWAATHVLRSPTRLRFLFRGGGRSLWYLSQFLQRIVPRASRELRHIRALAEAIPDSRLRHEALASASAKSFHVAGACVLATFLPPAATDHFIEIVTPLETIYDYLDNLCDRHPEVKAQAYPVLHRAVADALDPSAAPRAYYELGPSGDDGGYLRTLVERTQSGVRRLGGYESLEPYFAEAAKFYGELQTYRHLPPAEREPACIAWYERNQARFADLEWFEFACGSGSNLHVFGPLYALFSNRADTLDATYHAYFPALAALHIFLDSYIDQAEDREHDDLNFAECYRDEQAMLERARYLAQSFENAIVDLPDPDRHRFVLRILALFYLTHPKIAEQRLDAQAQRLLQALDVG